MKFIRRTINWLGPARAQAFFFLLAFTGLASLILNAIRPQPDWVRVVQSLLVVGFLIGATIIILSRVAPRERRQLAMAVGPFIAAVALGLLFPQLWLFFIPVGTGWLFIALFMVRGRVTQEYRAAIKHMRNGEFQEAIAVITELIEKEPENADHYRFRAELFRLWGKIKRARGDYQKVIELTPQSGVGYNGLAEVYLQDSEFEEALPYAKKALELEPDFWVAPYNLGMIEDRLDMSAEVAQHLNEALNTGYPGQPPSPADTFVAGTRLYAAG